MAKAPNQQQCKLFVDGILNSLDDDEKDLDTIIKTTHNFLSKTAMENSIKVLKEETKKDESSFNHEEKKKIYMLTNIFYEEYLEMLKKNYLNRFFFFFRLWKSFMISIKCLLKKSQLFLITFLCDRGV